MRKTILFIFILTFAACSSIGPAHIKRHSPVERNRKYIVFPFTDPVSRSGAELNGIGKQFANEFVSACAEEGLDIHMVNDKRFSSSEPVPTGDAIEYGAKKEAAYIITGQVIRWVDVRDSYTSGLSDLAAFRIVVRGVISKKIAFSGEVRAKSGTFWSGTPKLFVKRLAEEMAEVFLEK